MRKAVSISFIIIISLFLLVSAEAAQLSDFQGNWVNVDRNTRGITKVFVGVAGINVTVQAWGQCHPQDCDWGTVKATAYTSNVSSSEARDTRALTAVFNQGFKKTFLVIHPPRNNQVRIESYDEFLGRDRRSNYTSSFVMKRLHVAGSVQTRPGLQPVKPYPGQSETPGRIATSPGIQTLTPSTGGQSETPGTTPGRIATRPGLQPVGPTTAVREDCVSFNPNTTAVRNISGRWKIVDGSHWLFDFGRKESEARKALSLIKSYRMNQSCFVGRPNPSFQYMLSSGRSPVGSVSGEDCVSFNPNTTAVKHISGRWKIVDGSHWLFDFGRKESEARQALAIIKKYGFNRSCFVGRPHPSFQYLKRHGAAIVAPSARLATQPNLQPVGPSTGQSQTPGKIQPLPGFQTVKPSTGQSGTTTTPSGKIPPTLPGARDAGDRLGAAGITPSGMASALREDCISFNPKTTAVKNISGRWKIVDGSHWMFDFGGKEKEARQALSLIKRYRMNKSCFVGRPNPSFQYMLSSGRAPVGSAPGEDCISFNPKTTQVKKISGRWKIVDGSHWMFDFGGKESEARQALAIIKKYGFTRSCFVGRPNPSFKYLRR